MHPILFHLDLAGRSITVSSYSLFLVLGIVAAAGLAYGLTTRSGLPRGRSFIVILATVAGLMVGARLLNVVLNLGYYSKNPELIYRIGWSGFSLYGGLMLGVGAGVGTALALGLPPWTLLDAATPAAALGMVMARIGCFLNGCCFGTITDLPWAVNFPPGSPAWLYHLLTGASSPSGASAPVHPTQVYEMVGVVMALAVAAGMMHSTRLNGLPGRRTSGRFFLVFAGLFCAVRLGNHFLRAPVSASAFPVWFYPVLYSGLIALCAAVLILRLRSRWV